MALYKFGHFYIAHLFMESITFELWNIIFFPLRFFIVELGTFSNLGSLANGNLVSKVSKKPLEQFSKQFGTNV